MNAKEYKPTHGGYPGAVPEPVNPVKQLLIDGRALISNRDNWTQFKLARRADGEGVSTVSPAATCWCTYGALCKFRNGDMWSNDAEQALLLLDKAAGIEGGAIRLNDTRNHEDVLRMWDKAIASI